MKKINRVVVHLAIWRAKQRIHHAVIAVLGGEFCVELQVQRNNHVDASVKTEKFISQKDVAGETLVQIRYYFLKYAYFTIQWNRKNSKKNAESN